MIEIALLASSLIVANPETEDPSRVLHCHPLAHILHSLADPKYQGFFEAPIRIDDENGLELVRSFYNYMNEEKDQEGEEHQEQPKWTLAVMVKEKDKGGFLMVGFSVKPERTAGDNPELGPDKAPADAIEGMCRTIRLSSDAWSALDNKLHGHRS